MPKYIEDPLAEGASMRYELKMVLDAQTSPFQLVEMVETVPFGRALILDGLIQSSELDEFIYHESLVHPAMFAHPNPKRVFIGGGGEGSTAREVLRHSSVTECIMVDIDGVCVDFCKKHWQINAPAFADPRLRLVIDDAKAELMKEANGSLDVIIMDLDDPLEGGPCFQLYTQEFYQTIMEKLSPDGVFVTQTSGGGPSAFMKVLAPVLNTCRTIFPVCVPYAKAIFSFGDEWCWVMAFKNAAARLPAADAIDGMIASRISGGAGALRFLDGAAWPGLFSLGKHVRAGLASEKRILTRENPAIFLGSTLLEGRNTVKL